MLLALGLLGFATSARAAAPCGSTGKPWVSVTFDSSSFGAAFAERVLGDLRAGLETRGIEACREGDGPSTPPLASVRIAGTSGPSVAVAVEIRDAITEKRVMRDLDLSRVPQDGRAFAVAIAIDELVWASWAEIALAKRSKKKRPKPPPPEVVKGVEHALPEREVPSFRLGARFAFSGYGGGQTHLGADVAAHFPLGERLLLALSGGLRQGRPENAPHGRVLASAAGLEAALGVALLRALPLELSLFAGPRAALVRFSGRPTAESRGGELSGLVLYARGGAAFGLRLLGPLWLDLSGGAGAPLRALEATDAGQVITGVSGLELFARGGLMVEL
jgi:hypothetical protein